MLNVSDADKEEYCVLVNADGQYSLWSAFRELPAGWVQTGPSGSRQVCLDWIESNWTDMRPRSAQPGTST